ncbi:MAG: 4Fe-4S binding protein [Bacteroidales bacterium]|nr:4Fe-4S binding protein [Bacteroidales bacterium]
MKDVLKLTKFKFAIIFFLLFIMIGVWRWTSTNNLFYLIIFGYIGFAIAFGNILNVTLSKEHKHWGRKTTQLLVGLFMVGFLGFIGNENMQIEGFFFYLFSGIFAGATLHYFIAKIVGPLFFGRQWCGWACWTTMILDFFPWTKPKYQRNKKLGIIRYLHFFVSLCLILFLFYIAEFKEKDYFSNELLWMIIGNVAYYIIAIFLAFRFKDNRAFCKYVCPIPVSQKLTSYFAILKQKVNNEKCTECGLCEKNCPMDIEILKYAKEGKRTLSTECILCNTCIDICPTNAIKTTLGLDFQLKEYIN